MNEEAWTSLVIAEGETTHHGKNPQDRNTTLCGQVRVTDLNTYRAAFYGTGPDDCPTCAGFLSENHY